MDKNSNTMPALTTFELGLITKFLSIAEDEFSNESCDEFVIPASPANLAVLAPMVAGKIAEYGDEWEHERNPTDYLAHSSTLPEFYVVPNEWLAAYLHTRYAAALPERLDAAECRILAGLLENLTELFEIRAKHCDDEDADPFMLPPTGPNKAFMAAVFEKRKKRALAKKALEATKPITAPDFWVIGFLAHACARAAEGVESVSIVRVDASDEPDVPRAGPDPRFPAVQQFLKKYSQPFAEWRTKEMADLKRFADEGPGFTTERRSWGYGDKAAFEDLWHCARAVKRLAIHAALGTGKPSGKKKRPRLDAAAANQTFAKLLANGKHIYVDGGALFSASHYFGKETVPEDERVLADECDKAVSMSEYKIVRHMLYEGHAPEHIGAAMQQLAPYLDKRKGKECDVYIAQTVQAAQADEDLLDWIRRRDRSERDNAGAAAELADDWRPGWRQAVAYDYWSCRLAGENKYELGLDDACCTIANCLALGWDAWALQLVRQVMKRLEQGRFWDFDAGKRPFHQRRTQYFVLRLIAQWQGWACRNLPVQAFDEPLFEQLLERWRDPDPDKVAPLLLAACDRRMYQSRCFTGAKVLDLDNYRFWYDPFEILLMLDLRRRLGLANPVLDHPLMATPLGRLPTAAPPYTDEVLDGVVARARLEDASL
ncbi:hypothetical protein NX784_09865 [Massilia pinisoli]|uniref:RepB/MobA-like C-terminal domain-containing protein n=1 Tax=Massilia pinisoli TaxID=1772194 RepID=A0ABT1ZPR0_9BURK|nr:hypothetical protein [Massilia pinisoli]MCS0581897.1 hypothetical protein [Massilia pinisoli]